MCVPKFERLATLLEIANISTKALHLLLQQMKQILTLEEEERLIFAGLEEIYDAGNGRTLKRLNFFPNWRR
jgi:hypothetical protein